MNIKCGIRMGFHIEYLQMSGYNTTLSAILCSFDQAFRTNTYCIPHGNIRILSLMNLFSIFQDIHVISQGAWHYPGLIPGSNSQLFECISTAVRKLDRKFLSSPKSMEMPPILRLRDSCITQHKQSLLITVNIRNYSCL